MKHYIWSIDLYGAETWTLRRVYQEHVDGFEMWCWRRMKKISWTDHVRNKEVLHSQGGDEYPTHKKEGKKERKKERKANRICHIFRRNCLLKHVTG